MALIYFAVDLIYSAVDLTYSAVADCVSKLTPYTHFVEKVALVTPSDDTTPLFFTSQVRRKKVYVRCHCVCTW